MRSFNRRRDACFLATKLATMPPCCMVWVSIADATLASSQPDGQRRDIEDIERFNRRRDACFLATPPHAEVVRWLFSFNRRRDACFLATTGAALGLTDIGSFNRRRDACFLATANLLKYVAPVLIKFQSQTRRLLPRNEYREAIYRQHVPEFQSQTRRLLPRNWTGGQGRVWYNTFQSQTRRLLPRNFRPDRLRRAHCVSFNRRRDACFLATSPTSHSLLYRGLKFQSQTRRLLPRNDSMPGNPPTGIVFQSQTRRLLPRNRMSLRGSGKTGSVSIADATLASSQPGLTAGDLLSVGSFNRRRDACFLATGALLAAC